MASHKPVWSRLLLKPFLRSTNSDEKWVISANIVKQVIKSERYRPEQKPVGFLKGVPRRLNFLHKLHVVTCVGARFILSALHIVSFWGAPDNLQIIKSANQIGKTHSWNFLDNYLIKKSLLNLFTKTRKYTAQSTFFYRHGGHFEWYCFKELLCDAQGRQIHTNLSSEHPMAHYSYLKQWHSKWQPCRWKVLICNTASTASWLSNFMTSS